MNSTIQSTWVALRTAEVTVADGTIDGTTSGSTFWDLSSRAAFQVGPESSEMEIMFAGEAADGNTAAAKIYVQGASPPCHKICDISIVAGAAYYRGTVPNLPFTTKDTTTYLVADTIKLDGTNSYYADVSVYDLSVNGVSMIHFPVRGNSKVWVEFKTIAGAGNFTRITPFGRTW